MAFMVGIFYASTQLASVALDIPHPCQSHPDLSRAPLKSGHVLIGGIPNEPLPQTNLLIPTLTRARDIRKAELLKTKINKLNERAQKAAERVIVITAIIESKNELDGLLKS